MWRWRWTTGVLVFRYLFGYFDRMYLPSGARQATVQIAARVPPESAGRTWSMDGTESRRTSYRIGDALAPRSLRYRRPMLTAPPGPIPSAPTRSPPRVVAGSRAGRAPPFGRGGRGIRLRVVVTRRCSGCGRRSTRRCRGSTSWPGEADASPRRRSLRSSPSSPLDEARRAPSRGLCARLVLRHRNGRRSARCSSLTTSRWAGWPPREPEYWYPLEREITARARAARRPARGARATPRAVRRHGASPYWSTRALTESLGFGRAVGAQLRSHFLPKAPALAGLAVGWWIAHTYTDSHLRSALRSHRNRKRWNPGRELVHLRDHELLAAAARGGALRLSGGAPRRILRRPEGAKQPPCGMQAGGPQRPPERVGRSPGPGLVSHENSIGYGG